MKKLILSIIVVAALVSCSKTDTAYDNPLEIAFAPVAKKTTKAAVSGTTYPTGLDMYVFANAGTSATISEYTEPYFKNALFEHKENGIFGGTPAYYWPNVKKLIFSGVSASGNVNGTGTFAYNNTAAEWQITLADYQPGKGTATIGNNDLMWFPTGNNTYSKADVPGTDNTVDAQDNNIEVTMKHACSWITIKIKGDATTGASGTTWKIKSLKLDKLATAGTAVLGANAAWNSLTVTEPTAGTPNPDELIIHNNNTGDALTTSYVDYTKKSVVSSSTFEDFIAIPQTTRTLYITYSFVSQAAAGTNPEIVIEETKEIPLEFNGTNPWSAGVHYTYNITIGTKEILIEPDVTEWTPNADVNVTI